LFKLGVKLLLKGIVCIGHVYLHTIHRGDLARKYPA